MKDAERYVAGRAARQHGIFTYKQAMDLGMSVGVLRRLVGSGWCERAHQGVYVVRAAPPSVHQRILLSVLVAAPDAAASHRSGGQLWAVPGYDGRILEVTRPHGRSQRTDRGLVHGSLWLPPSHVTTRFGIAVTTPARTAFDLGGVVPAKRFERDVDDLIHRGLCTVRQLQQVFFALARRGRRGTVAMRQRLEAMGEGYIAPASELERRARELFASAGLPLPRFEVEVGDSEWIGRVDCLWEAERVIVELDGHRHHGSPLQAEADRKRDNELMASGWRVIRVRWDDLNDRPALVVTWIRSALAAAG
ncbi:type IV toxin-antitoxin system AbiEi family antitoxin domain-containing protein [Aquihabitans sp. McL0605]|uniref:type IV toxin-antitoxin system AbiEi family antitoxin domain-containing protein n=1 Tax=Aquihabitans sp. McL0605 TaxID=3415671 RepID=UPI003CF55C70